MEMARGGIEGRHREGMVVETLRGCEVAGLGVAAGRGRVI